MNRVAIRKGSKILIYIIAFYSGIFGGYLSPFFGITIFFWSSFLLYILFFRETELYPDSLSYLLFAAYSILSAIWAPDKWGAILFSQSLLGGALFYSVVRSIEGSVHKILKILLLCGVINGIIGFYQGLSGDAQGLFYNRNPYAGFLTPLVFVALHFFLMKENKLMGSIGVFLLFSVLISESRGAMYSTLIGFLFMLGYFAKERRWKEFKYVLFIFLLGVGLYFAYLLLKRALALPERKIIEEGLESLRWTIFKTYPHLFLSSPILGHGLNSFFYIKDKVEAPEMNILFEGQIHAHNIFFNILLELGLIGITLFLFFLYSVIGKKKTERSFLLFLPLLLFILPNLFEYNFPAPPFQVLFLSLCANYLEKERKRICPSLLKSVTTFGTLIFFLLFSVMPVSGTILLKKGIELITRGDAESGFGLLNHSTLICLICSQAPKAKADFLFGLYMATENKDNRLLSIIEREYKRAIGLSKSVENYVSLSKFYFRTGRKKEAQSVLLEAQKDYPYSVRLKMEMGKFYIATKDYSKAIHLLTEIEDLLRKYDNEGRRRIEVLEALARAKKEIGDIEGVKKIEDELKAIKK